MNAHIDPVEITGRLVRMNTVNPPGNEQVAVEYLAGLLERAGFAVREIPLDHGRSSLVATLKRTEGPSLCFSGHLDTVPTGDAAWSVDPFAGEIRDDRLYGRGSSDMKSGVAVMSSAAIECAADPARKTNLILAYSAAEESGCQGARTIAEHLAGAEDVGALVVAEPTDNTVRLGHKGALWLRLHFSGITAHGAMPHLGKNAVYSAVAVVAALADWGPEIGDSGPLGAPTMNVGTFHGGMNVNSVPDAATVELDIRTVPGVSPDELLAGVQRLCGPEVEITVMQGLPSVYTDPADPWVEDVLSITRRAGIRPAESPGLSYFTDAGVLKPALGDPPTVFQGPGTPERAHQTDEWCSIARILQAHELFGEVIRRFSDRNGDK